jgi:hypothetical protein
LAENWIPGCKGVRYNLIIVVRTAVAPQAAHRRNGPAESAEFGLRDRRYEIVPDKRPLIVRGLDSYQQESLMSTATAPILDIGRTLDDGPFTGMQKMVVLMAALAIVLDGFDGQFIGFAIPLMIKEWGASKEAFGVPVAAGLIVWCSRPACSYSARRRLPSALRPIS